MLLYLASLALIAAATHGASRLGMSMRGEILPSARSIFQLIGVIAGLGYFALLVTGFFYFAWWVPLVGIPASWIVGGIVSAILPNVASPILLLAGAACAIAAIR